MANKLHHKCTLIHLLEKIGNEGEMQHDQLQTKEVNKIQMVSGIADVGALQEPFSARGQRR